MPRAAEDFVSLARLDATVFETSNSVRTRHNENGAFSVWERSHRKLGQGSFGAVYREECVEGRSLGTLRAVKVIQKLTSLDSRRSKVDYSKELEAIARFSQPQVRLAFSVREHDLTRMSTT